MADWVTLSVIAAVAALLHHLLDLTPHNDPCIPCCTCRYTLHCRSCSAQQSLLGHLRLLNMHACARNPAAASVLLPTAWGNVKNINTLRNQELQLAVFFAGDVQRDTSTRSTTRIASW
jgi:hypothetical protein